MRVDSRSGINLRRSKKKKKKIVLTGKKQGLLDTGRESAKRKSTGTIKTPHDQSQNILQRVRRKQTVKGVNLTPKPPLLRCLHSTGVT